jgi:uncharacterized protein involved in exopolysaccharide biosynthesis
MRPDRNPRVASIGDGGFGGLLISSLAMLMAETLAMSIRRFRGERSAMQQTIRFA